VNPSDGKVLWSQPIEAFRGMNILTPVVYKDTLFTSSYGGKTLGFRVTQADGTFKVSQIWTHKAQGYMSTPVVVNGVAYEHLKSQRLMAIEVETGRELWTASEGFGKYVSLVVQGDRLLALDQRGWLYLLRANPKQFELLGKRRLSEEESWAHLAVAGNDLVVRELNALVAYRWAAP
jgi:outer membrane protein assembly factor BamB